MHHLYLHGHILFVTFSGYRTTYYWITWTNRLRIADDKGRRLEKDPAINMDISNNTYAAACAGSKDAYASIVNKYKSLICAITYNTTGNLELSEEIAQEVFLTGWQHLSELRSPSKLRSWLCGIARNIARDKNRITRQKKQRHSPRTLSQDHMPTVTPSN